jgi:predicted CopG family antitoxin
MAISKAENSLNYAKCFSDVPITVEEYMKIKGFITKECRWYLVGKYCDRDKYRRSTGESVQDLLIRLAQEFDCSEPTLRRFVSYAKAIDYLQSVVPDVVSELISGKLRMSVENVRSLANRPDEEIPKIIKRIKSGEEWLYQIFPERAVKSIKTSLPKRLGKPVQATVKDTPKYDPDAQVTGLTYTIPSWSSVIDRVFMSNDFRVVSKDAREKLLKELFAFKSVTDLLLELLGEKGTEGYL